MKNFPNNINVVNKDKFNDFFRERTLCYLRREIYEHMLCRKDETTYFDISNFSSRYCHKLKNIVIKNMIDTITQELENLGWKCKSSYGGTGLFIYSTDEPPANCYPDEF